MKTTLAILIGLLPLTAEAQTPNPCLDPAGAARALKAANPGMDNQTLYLALVKGQEMYGCRAPAPTVAAPAYPATTRCAWEGLGLSRQWVCRAD